jgi:hypothetical protein
VFNSKEEVAALFAAYKVLEEQNIEFVNHGTFRSLEATCHGMQGFWVLVEGEDPKFVPREVVEGLSRCLIKAEAVSLRDMPTVSVVPSPEGSVDKSLNWDSPEIQRRLLDIMAEAQAADTRYIRVISKSKAGRQTTLARIPQGANADVVVKTIMHARRKTKERTVMAEVLKKNLKRSMARSFPLDLHSN